MLLQNSTQQYIFLAIEYLCQIWEGHETKLYTILIALWIGITQPTFLRWQPSETTL